MYVQPITLENSVIEPEVSTNRQAANDPDQFVDDTAADLLIDLLRDAVNSLVSRPAGDLERTSVLSIPLSGHASAALIACALESA